MESLHMHSLIQWTTVSAHERTSMGLKADNKHHILSHLFSTCQVICGLTLLNWKNGKQVELHVGADQGIMHELAVDYRLGWLGRRRERKEYQFTKMRRGLFDAMQWEQITSEKRTVVLWRMTEWGGLISSTCYPEGFSSLWERDKCIRETKEGRMKHRTELIRWETKEQKEASHIIVPLPKPH